MDRQPLDDHAVQRRLLDRDWTLADLQEAVALAAYLDAHPACREAIETYDQVRRALAPADAVAGDATDRVPPMNMGSTAETNHPDAEPVGGWQAFDRRLSGRIQAITQPTPIRRPRWQWPLQLAAAVLLTTVAWKAGEMTGHGPGPAGAPIAGAPDADHARYLPADADQQVDVFGEVSAVFDRRAGWVAFANGRSELGISDHPVAVPPRLLVIRLTLARQGQTISQTDLVIVPGQRATLDLPLDDGQLLRYQLHVSDERPARLALWAELEHPDGRGDTLAALATRLQLQPGQVMPAGSMATEAGGYELTLGFREARASGRIP
ncbi:MAG: hypothetical protein WD534_16990 [Phycisphaeraceae bacterium]